jgi:hypothetical protein
MRGGRGAYSLGLGDTGPDISTAGFIDLSGKQHHMVERQFNS